MVQNRNKLLDLFIGNMSNAVVHRILERCIDNPEIAKRYVKESATSLEIAKRYREKINPTEDCLPVKDIDYIRTKIVNKVNSELMFRISKGYKGIDLGLVSKFADDALKEMKVAEE
ncbi:hypothetical protein J4206_04425 [Candidatus Woesearchaeota archaeon]|nr:hypothetical protein [Candidatus Woesearchaeota archaeon]